MDSCDIPIEKRQRCVFCAGHFSGYVSHWDKNGKLHREDGPATYTIDGIIKVWYKHGLVHNLTGPAYIDTKGGQHWYIDGNYVSLKIWDWADERGIDLKNMTDEDKCALYFDWKDYSPDHKTR